MKEKMTRRDFAREGLSVSAGLALRGLPGFWPSTGSSNDAKWRTFEVTTRINIMDAVGGVRVWVPVPLMTNADYFKREPDKWGKSDAEAWLFRQSCLLLQKKEVKYAA
jgi:hypothetical protein